MLLTTASYAVKFGRRSPPCSVTKAPLFPIVSLDTKYIKHNVNIWFCALETSTQKCCESMFITPKHAPQSKINNSSTDEPRPFEWEKGGSFPRPMMFHPCRLKVPTGDELPRNGLRSMRHLLLLHDVWEPHSNIFCCMFDSKTDHLNWA